MTKYDDASWHYEGDYPDDLPDENAAIHIGMFLKWCVEARLISDELLDDEKENIAKVAEHKMSGAELLWLLDGKLTCDDLNDEGNAFALDYYEGDTAFSNLFSDYGTDFCDIFDKKAEDNGFEYESLYHVEDTLENYLLMKPILDSRFAEWKRFSVK